VLVESYNVIVLDTTIPQPAVSLLDIVRGDIRFREGNHYIFPRQPVTRINSLQGSVTGTVSTSAYALQCLADPLLEGRSTRAQDYLLVTDSGTGVIPSGTPVVVTSESHVLIGSTVEYLSNLGINPLTVRVFNTSRTLEYSGPFDPLGADFTILETTGNPVAIVRVDTGAILSGQEVLVDYDHDENFVVSYDTNFLITAMQDALDEAKHITADVLAKESFVSRVNLAATIVLSRGQTPLTVDNAIRTNLENYMRGLGMGNPLRPSDVVGVIEGTQGVSFLVLPLTQMVRDEGSWITYEGVLTDQTTDFTRVSTWSTTQASVYLVRDGLNNATTTGGGPTNIFRGVFEEDTLLALQLIQPDTLGYIAGQSYIIGGAGLVIPGISDDTTLFAQGFVTNAAISAQRLVLTANHILLSLPAAETPLGKNYKVTYVVGVDTGVKQIEADTMESLSLGTLTFTFDEDRANVR
jgi:hypothetical protein